MCAVMIMVSAIRPSISEGAHDQGRARAKQISDGFAVIQTDYHKLKSEIDNAIRVKLNVYPRLLLPGEQITVSIKARSEKKPNPMLWVLENCYDLKPTLHSFKLDWIKSKSGSGYSAVWKWKPTRCGSYLLHWKCDIGGDVPEFWRNFSVVDSSYAVMIINSTSHRKPRPEPDFHKLHLPFTYWWMPVLYGHRATAADFTSQSKWARQYGDDPGFMIAASKQYMKSDKFDHPFDEEPADVCKLVLSYAQRLAQMCRFPRPVQCLLSYGMGNGPMRAARAAGFHSIGALCPDQNWQDGDSKINDWGMPARPYFVSDEDFRKPGNGGPNGLVGIPQCERQTMECRDYDCIYAVEGGMTYWLDRASHRVPWNRPRVVNDALCSREDDFIRCFTQSAGQTKSPLFFSGCIEFNGVWPERAAANRNYMEYLVKCARDAHITYATASAVVNFYRRHYKQTPESVLYLVDIYAGITANGKPPLYPDTMEVENHLFRAIFLKGQTLPHVYYDYTTRWNYPDWGNEDIPRQKNGYSFPNTPNRYRVTPLLLDTRLFDAKTGVQDTATKTTVTIHVNAQKAQNHMALAVWDLPRQYNKDQNNYKLTGCQRFIPVRAAYTSNLCGIIVADVKKGNNVITLSVATRHRTPLSQDLSLGGNVMAKVIERDGISNAYIFTTGAVSKVTINPPPGIACVLYTAESDKPIKLEKPVTLKVKPGKYQHLIGLTYDQLLNCCPTARPAPSAQAKVVEELLSQHLH